MSCRQVLEDSVKTKVQYRFLFLISFAEGSEDTAHICSLSIQVDQIHFFKSKLSMVLILKPNS